MKKGPGDHAGGNSAGVNAGPFSSAVSSSEDIYEITLPDESGKEDMELYGKYRQCRIKGRKQR